LYSVSKAILNWQTRPGLLFVIPSASHFLWANATRFIFVFCQQSVSQLANTTRFIFVFRQQGDSQLAKATRFIFGIPQAKKLSFGKRDPIQFLYSVSKVILHWQTQPDSFFVFR
jgi:hypothetical protein